MKRKPKITTLKRKLDTVFSQYIRLKYSTDGYATCVTCGVTKHYKKLHAGHFVPRQHLAVRYDERNVHPQCPKCNTFNNGEPGAYAVFLIKKYGKNIIETLEKEKQAITKDFPYQEKIAHYKSQVSVLERNNGSMGDF